MIRVLIFFAVVVLVAFGAVWLADHPGTIMVVFQGQEMQTSTLVGLVLLIAAGAVVAIVWTLLRFVFRIPSIVSMASHNRRRQRGFDALSRGMVAVGAGDREVALRASMEATRFLKGEPMALLLRAQAAQMAGDRETAEKAFSEMLGHPETRALGLRGLHVEAQRRGDADAAYAYAEEALKTTTLPWAGQAVLTYRAQRKDWAGALSAVERNAGGRSIDRPTANRQRAVLSTAIALDMADRDPAEALRLVREALRFEPTLVPAAALAARLLTRKGDIKRATRLIETAYAATPHPELADAYVNVRPGDSATDRLQRAESLARICYDHPESRMLVARTALEAREFDRAREALTSLSGGPEGQGRPTAKVCLLMAEIEDAQHGETGTLFEWLQRASRAPRDPAWVADGVISDVWAPVSPSGKLDSFVWTTPKEQLSAPIDLQALRSSRGEAVVPQDRPMFGPAASQGRAALNGSTTPERLGELAPTQPSDAEHPL